MKKQQSIKAFVILVGLLLAGSFEANAQNSLGKEIADSKGLIISAAIIFGILLVYFVGKVFIKEQKETTKPRSKYVHHRQNHNHHRHVVRKTA
jgi:predicted DNA repair protein MutK